MSINYNQAPLPFQGQKRRFQREFKEALSGFNDAAVFVDLFGGSGLLSCWAKQVRPDARVVYNDFDNYHKRIAAIANTNAVLQKLRTALAVVPHDKVLPEIDKLAVLSILADAEREHGYVDYITLSSSLLFSMNYVTSYEAMSKQTMYNCVRLNDYSLATDYLQCVEVVCEHYRDLFERFKAVPGVVFLVDPPYLSTDVSTYIGYWKLGNYLDVLTVLKGTSYFYFTSDKSSIIELCEWIERNLQAENPFTGATRCNINSRINYNSTYTDIMLHKHV